MRWSLFLLSGCLTACIPPWSQSGTYAGYYTYGYEVSHFTRKGSKDKWWLAGSRPPCLTEYTKETVMNASKETPILYVEVRGELSAIGMHGHLGAYSRELKVNEVIVCRKLLADERPEF